MTTFYTYKIFKTTKKKKYCLKQSKKKLFKFKLKNYRIKIIFLYTKTKTKKTDDSIV